MHKHLQSRHCTTLQGSSDLMMTREVEQHYIWHKANHPCVHHHPRLHHHQYNYIYHDHYFYYFIIVVVRAVVIVVVPAPESDENMSFWRRRVDLILLSLPLPPIVLIPNSKRYMPLTVCINPNSLKIDVFLHIKVFSASEAGSYFSTLVLNFLFKYLRMHVRSSLISFCISVVRLNCMLEPVILVQWMPVMDGSTLFAASKQTSTF